MRMGDAARARARSLTRLAILLTLILARFVRPSTSRVQRSLALPELGDRRSLVHLYDLGRHTKAGQRVLDDAHPLADLGLAKFLFCRTLQDSSTGAGATSASPPMMCG